MGITSTFWEVNVSCSRIQLGDWSEDRLHVVYLQLQPSIDGALIHV